MEFVTLSEKQKETIGKLLSQAIINKEHPHPADLARAAIILYDVNRLGYLLTDHIVENILENSGQRYSDTMKEWLSHMANAYYDLVIGLSDPYYASHRVNESDLEK
jgi:hypothetical protein